MCNPSLNMASKYIFGNNTSLLSITMIFNIAERTDVTLAALVFFWGTEADSWWLVMNALSELDIHTWPARWEEETKKLPKEQIFSQNVEPICALQDSPALRKREATNCSSSMPTHCPLTKNSTGCMFKHLKQPIFIFSWQATFYGCAKNDCPSSKCGRFVRCYAS